MPLHVVSWWSVYILLTCRIVLRISMVVSLLPFRNARWDLFLLMDWWGFRRQQVVAPQLNPNFTPNLSNLTETIPRTFQLNPNYTPDLSQLNPNFTPAVSRMSSINKSSLRCISLRMCHDMKPSDVEILLEQLVFCSSIDLTGCGMVEPYLGGIFVT